MTPIIALVIVLLLGATPALAKPKGPPCDAGRYLLTTPLVTGQAAPPADAIEAGASRVSIGAACGRLAPQRFKVAAGGTKIKAIWPSCAGFTGRVKLTGTIGEGCTLLRGRVKAKRFQARVEARRSTCGDGEVDAAGGEDCDPPGAGCDTRCRRLAPAAIGAAGGRVTSDDGLLTLEAPAGALAGDTTLTIRPLAPAEAAALGGDLGWDLGPDGTQFATPITATLTLPGSPLAEDGSLRGALGALFTVNGAGDPEFPSVQRLLVDGSANVATLSVELTHFTPLIVRNDLAFVDVTFAPGTTLRPLQTFRPHVVVQLRSEPLNDQGIIYIDQTAPGDIIVYGGAAEVELGKASARNTRVEADVIGYACGEREGLGEYRARLEMRTAGFFGIGAQTTLIAELSTLIKCEKPRRRTTTTSTSTTSTSSSSRPQATVSTTSVTATTAATSTSSSSTRTTTTTSTSRTTTTTTSTLPRSNCCDCPAGRCASGPLVQPADCTDFGCTFVANATCSGGDGATTGECIPLTTTTSSSSSSSSTSSSTSSTTSTTGPTGPSVSKIPVDAPEGLDLVGALFLALSNGAGAVVSGANGWAIVDYFTGEVLVSGYTGSGRPPLFGAVPLAQPPPAGTAAIGPQVAGEPDLQGVIQVGLNGPAITLYDVDAGDFGFTQIFPGSPACLDAVPYRNDPLSGETVLACGAQLLTLQPDDTSTFFEFGPTYSGFTATTGPVFSGFRRRAGGPIVAVTNGTPGKIFKHAVTGALGETPQEIGNAGNSPRRIRCAGGVCAVSNFASDSLTIVTWSAQDVVSIVGTVGVGDGPVGIDVRERTDGNVEVVSTGLNDDSYSVTVLRPNGSTVSNQKRAVPTGCSKPGHIVWGDGRLVVMTCNGSDAIARAQAP